MGRRRKFDKNSGVTLKLQYRSTDDPAYKEGGLLSDRIFSVIEPLKSKEHKLKSETKDFVLSQFSEKDLGIIDEKAARKQKKEKLLKQKEQGSLSSLPTELALRMKGRDDLWINQLNRMKVDEELKQIEEEERREKKAQKSKSAVGQKSKDDQAEDDDDEEGEWEDEEEEKGDADDDEEDEDWEDEGEDDEEDWEEEEEEFEEVDMDEEQFDELYGDNVPQLVDPLKMYEDSNPKPVRLQDPDAEVDLKKVELAAGIRTKRYDENGLPLDGYDYYQHISDPDKSAPADFIFVAQYKEKPKIAKDIDINFEKLTDEQKELLAALDNEEEGAYDELEDDFIDLINNGEACVIEKPTLPQKKSTKKSDDTMEISYDKSELKNEKPKKQVQFAPVGKSSDGLLDQPASRPKPAVNIHSKKDFMKIIESHAQKMRERFLETGKVEKEEAESSEVKEKRININRKTQRIPNEKKEKRTAEEPEEELEDEDEEAEELRVEERLAFKDDVAMQQVMNESSSDEDGSVDHDQDDKDETDTVASRSFYAGPAPILNIVKETAKKSKKEANEAKKEDIVDPNGKKEEEEEESSEDEDEDADVSVVSEVFTQRRRGETKEEKKARKLAIKEFKNERKSKKREFKNNFEGEKKKHLDMNEKQAGASNPKGFSVYKLS